MLVTDAMPLGRLRRRPLRASRPHRLSRQDGKLTLADGTLAGSDLDMASAVRNTVTHLGLPLEAALHMASRAPAEFLGLGGELGRIAPGYRASLVLLDDDLNVTETWIDGRAAKAAHRGRKQPMPDLRFEICVDSVAGVLAARDAGADRVELCASLIEGGITPSLGTILVARKVADIRIHVIIRPRGGDFLYDADEIAAMEADIATAKSAGVDGSSSASSTATAASTGRRPSASSPAPRPASVTFHRAFDMTPDPLVALETLIELGVDRVLTSGQEPTAYEGAERIAELVKSAGERIIVMPGGGITAAKRRSDRRRHQGARDSTSPHARRGQSHALPPPRRLYGRRTPPARI